MINRPIEFNNGDSATDVGLVQQQTPLSSLTNMSGLSPNIPVISQSNEKPTGAVTVGVEQSYMTRAMPGQTGEMPTQSIVVKPETGMSGASLPSVNQAADFNDEERNQHQESQKTR